jgi:hypothetical protein
MLLQSYLPPPRSKTRTDRFLSVSLMYGVLFSFFAFVLFFIIPNFFPLVKKKFEKMRFNTKCAWDENRRQLSKMFKISRKQLTFFVESCYNETAILRTDACRKRNIAGNPAFLAALVRK